LRDGLGLRRWHGVLHVDGHDVLDERKRLSLRRGHIVSHAAASDVHVEHFGQVFSDVQSPLQGELGLRLGLHL
jgi:hypothetical protein